MTRRKRMATASAPHRGGREISKSDEVLLESPLGHTNDCGVPDPQAMTKDEACRDVSARPRSEITGQHDEGSDANETVDGLSEMGETVRRYAEDVPTTDEVDSLRELPVFDRAASLPKV
jgi:hypothetical protein